MCKPRRSITCTCTLYWSIILQLAFEVNQRRPEHIKRHVQKAIKMSVPPATAIRDENAITAANKAFVLCPAPPITSNPKTTRRRKGKSEGHYLAQRRQRDEQRSRLEAKQPVTHYQRPATLRSHVSAPLLGLFRASTSPSRQVMSCLTFQHDSDTQSSSNGSTSLNDGGSKLPIRDLQPRQAAGTSDQHQSSVPDSKFPIPSMSYDDPPAGFDASLKDSGINEAEKYMRQLPTQFDRSNSHQNQPIMHLKNSFPQKQSTSGIVYKCANNSSQSTLRRSQSVIGYGLTDKARSLSKSFRKKFSRSISRTPSDSTTTHQQHIAARTNHFGSSMRTPFESDHSRHDFWNEFRQDVPDQAPLPPPHSDLTLMKQSNQYADSETTDGQTRSRVTSWTQSDGFQSAGSNSIALNSVAQHLEDSSDHEADPFTSYGQRHDSRLSCSSIQGVKPTDTSTDHSRHIDSRRVYSALMKRISLRGRPRPGAVKDTSTVQVAAVKASSDHAQTPGTDERPVVTRYNNDKTTVRIVRKPTACSEHRPEASTSLATIQVAFNRGRELMSPSIYSESAKQAYTPTPRSSQLRHRVDSSEVSGIATVHGSRPVARFSLAESPSLSQFAARPEQVLQTSAEWRSWADSQLNSLKTSQTRRLSLRQSSSKSMRRGHLRESTEIYGTKYSESPITSHEQNVIMQQEMAHEGQDPDKISGNQENDATRLTYLPGYNKTLDEIKLKLPEDGRQAHKQAWPVLPLTERRNSEINLRSSHKQRLDSEIGGFECQHVLRNTRTVADIKTAPIPSYSPTDDNLLQRIRRGPYGYESSPLGAKQALFANSRQFKVSPSHAEYHERPDRETSTANNENENPFVSRRISSPLSPSNCDLLDYRSHRRVSFSDISPQASL